jgi:hypothetical protein
MFIITKPFSASENGHEVIEYQPGTVDQLPPVALAHGINIGAVVEEEISGESEITTAAADDADSIDVTTIEQDPAAPTLVAAKQKGKK